MAYMRTNIVIDDDLMEAAMKAGNFTTKRDAVEEGSGAAPTAAWAAVGRGDVLTIRGEGTGDGAGDGTAKDAPVDDRGRIAQTAQIDVWPIRK